MYFIPVRQERSILLVIETIVPRKINVRENWRRHHEMNVQKHKHQEMNVQKHRHQEMNVQKHRHLEMNVQKRVLCGSYPSSEYSCWKRKPLYLLRNRNFLRFASTWFYPQFQGSTEYSDEEYDPQSTQMKGMIHRVLRWRVWSTVI
jgi:hypothetical protein